MLTLLVGTGVMSSSSSSLFEVKQNVVSRSQLIGHGVRACEREEENSKENTLNLMRELWELRHQTCVASHVWRRVHHCMHLDRLRYMMMRRFSSFSRQSSPRMARASVPVAVRSREMVSPKTVRHLIDSMRCLLTCVVV